MDAGLYETWMVLEYCDRGSLDEVIRTKRYLRRPNGDPDLGAVYRCLIDVAQGMVSRLR